MCMVQLIRDVKPNVSFFYTYFYCTIKVFYTQALVDLLSVYFIPTFYKANFCIDETVMTIIQILSII